VGSLPTTQTITALVSDLANPQVLYASSADGVFKSRDAGDTWEAASAGLSEIRVIALALHPTELSRLYAVTASGIVWRSNDRATTWQRQGQLPGK
jgi:photosystem II stability/assembly factor-like uncharacterized protein